jgi:hypothetical protein
MYWMELHRPIETTALIRTWDHSLVGSPLDNSGLEVCRFPINARVVDYSCRTTVKREVLI